LSSARRAAYQRLLQDQDLAAIEELARRDLEWRAPLAPDLARRIVALALENPSRSSAELLAVIQTEGNEVELVDVEAFLAAHHLSTLGDRLLRLQETYAAGSGEPTPAQNALIEAANPCFVERRTAARRPGELLVQDHVRVGE